MSQIESENGTLSYSGWTEVIYKGKVFPAPVDIVILMSYDYILELLITGDYKK